MYKIVSTSYLLQKLSLINKTKFDTTKFRQIENFDLMKNKVLLSGIVFFTFAILLATHSSFNANNIQVFAVSSYDSGFDHGCDDAKISDHDERYINQPGKGNEDHSTDFMNGYNDGFDECFDNGNNDNGGSDNDDNNLFKLIVKITNRQFSRDNLDTDLHVDINNNNGISQSIDDIELPHPGTKTYSFAFDSDDVPVGTEYTVYFKYGGTTYERHGENTESNSPEYENFNVNIR